MAHIKLPEGFPGIRGPMIFRMENFWSLLKRAIKGTYVSIEPFHLFGCLDEQSFRYNVRRDNDGKRFQKILNSIAGKRLTWNVLTAQEVGWRPSHETRARQSHQRQESRVSTSDSRMY